MRIPIRFDSWYRLLSSALALPPSGAYVEVEKDEIQVRMSWAFRAQFPRAAVRSLRELAARPSSRGVHGFAGRWLVNGSGRGIVAIELDPPQRATVLGFPVKLRELLVSVDDPAQFKAALDSASSAQPAEPTE